MSNRIYIGKIAGINKSDLQNICQQQGELVDLIIKDTFAFAVRSASALSVSPRHARAHASCWTQAHPTSPPAPKLRRESAAAT